MFHYTVVMPCLNEERTLAACIREAQIGAEVSGKQVEIIVADNGSSDRSVEIAQELNCRVINVNVKGYGAALDAGIRAASSNFVVMGDSDLSYNFTEAPRFLAELEKGFDVVIGNRFAGGIETGAMPWHHRYIGNPVLSRIGRLFFRIPISDFHCGLRAVRVSKYLQAAPTTTGMEFATEMIARFANAGANFTEIPIKLRKDGRNRKPHLRSFPDGWRHLKMMLLFSPQYFLLYPGITLLILGAYGLLSFALTGTIDLLIAKGNVQASIFSLVSFMLGLQLTTASFISMAVAKAKLVTRFKPWESLEKVLTSKLFLSSSIALSLVGVFWLASIGSIWLQNDFPSVNPLSESRKTIPLVGLVIAGGQGILCSIQVRQVLSKFW
jgi:glycosyltransferase involved in cell wall biosynthesis